jgi:hypothetical protein
MYLQLINHQCHVHKELESLPKDLKLKLKLGNLSIKFAIRKSPENVKKTRCKRSHLSNKQRVNSAKRTFLTTTHLYIFENLVLYVPHILRPSLKPSVYSSRMRSSKSSYKIRIPTPRISAKSSPTLITQNHGTQQLQQRFGDIWAVYSIWAYTQKQSAFPTGQILIEWDAG